MGGAQTFFWKKMGGTDFLAVQNPQMNDCSAAEDNNNINNNNGSSEVVGTSPNWDWVIRDSLWTTIKRREVAVLDLKPGDVHEETIESGSAHDNVSYDNAH